MLEVLLAIKNNNMAKIPNYDPSHSEHLKKLMKGFLHKGSCVTELRITLDDLLKGDFYSVKCTQSSVLGSCKVHIFMGQVRENGNSVTSCYVDSIYRISGAVINGLDVKHFTVCVKST